jgi:hypothetical protein
MTTNPLIKRYYKAGCLILSFATFILCLTSVFAISKAASLAPRSFSIIQTEPPPGNLYVLSGEQQALIDQFGYPDAFTIQFYVDSLTDQSQQEVRLEIWTYYLAGQEITLLNGQVIDRFEIDIPYGALAPVPYRPEQFTGNMDADTALLASGLQEYIKAPLETESVPGGILLFGEQIVLGLKDDNLLYVEGFALEEGGQP